jgi:predicted permease
MTLLVGAGLFVNSLRKIAQLDYGLEPDKVLAVNVNFRYFSRQGLDESLADQTRERELVRTLITQIRRLPSVENVSAGIGTPFFGSAGVSLRVPGLDSLPHAKGGGPFISAVTPGYFETVGTRIVRGRGFTNSDNENSERVTVVSETMARLLWPGQDPLGKCILIFSSETDVCTRVIGIAVDARRSQLVEDPAMQYYVPFGQEMSISGPQLLIRPRQDNLRSIAPDIRAAISRVEPELRTRSIRTWQESLDPQIRPWRIGALLFGACAMLALVVASVGVFSLVSYYVAARASEFAIRLALGAGSLHIIRLALAAELGSVLAGIFLGVVSISLLSPVLQPLLFETSAQDPSISVISAAVVMLSALAAAFFPAVRALSIDPSKSLRAE